MHDTEFRNTYQENSDKFECSTSATISDESITYNNQDKMSNESIRVSKLSLYKAVKILICYLIQLVPNAFRLPSCKYHILCFVSTVSKGNKR